MKCPKCGHNHKAKYGMKCGACGYGFVFNPKASPGISDGKFQGLLRKASQQDTIWFTVNHLHARICEVNTPLPAGCLVFALIILISGLVMLLKGMDPGIPVLVFGIFGVMVSAAGMRRQRPDVAQVEKMVKAWKRAGYEVDKLIEEPGLAEPPPDAGEPDIHDYGVERVLIVERDILVDLFVRNGWHAEQRSLVIAESGYPEYLLPMAQKLLVERPDLPVALLHDSTAHGQDMEQRVRDEGRFDLGEHPVLDLGLGEADVAKIQRLQPYLKRKDDYRVPVDALPGTMLAAGVMTAMTDMVPLGGLLLRKEAGAEARSSFG